MQKTTKTCNQCKFVCKKNKICNKFVYGIKEYQVCFYDDFGDGTPICYDESFYDVKDTNSLALVLSYIGCTNIRVFVIYHDGTQKELKMINCVSEEACFLEGSNDLNVKEKNYEINHNKILKIMERDNNL